MNKSRERDIEIVLVVVVGEGRGTLAGWIAAGAGELFEAGVFRGTLALSSFPKCH